MTDKVYFVTNNPFKKEAVTKIFEDTGIGLQVIDMDIMELMHLDLDMIVKDKLLKAYQQFGRPCAVENGAIHIDAINRLPGGISKVVWANVGDKICQFIKPGEVRRASARSLVGYCDGKKMYFFLGETKGEIAIEARGDRKFEWDPIFIPDGSKVTYAEMKPEEKDDFCQRVKAWKQLIDFLKTQDN